MKEDLKIRIDGAKKKWDGRITKLITPKSVAVFTTVVYVLSLVPLLWLAWYNYPSADDYSIGSNCHQDR